MGTYVLLCCLLDGSWAPGTILTRYHILLACHFKIHDEKTE